MAKKKKSSRTARPSNRVAPVPPKRQENAVSESSQPQTTPSDSVATSVHSAQNTIETAATSADTIAPFQTEDFFPSDTADAFSSMEEAPASHGADTASQQEQTSPAAHTDQEELSEEALPEFDETAPEQVFVVGKVPSPPSASDADTSTTQKSVSEAQEAVTPAQETPNSDTDEDDEDDNDGKVSEELLAELGEENTVEQVFVTGKIPGETYREAPEHMPKAGFGTSAQQEPIEQDTATQGDLEEPVFVARTVPTTENVTFAAPQIPSPVVTQATEDAGVQQSQPAPAPSATVTESPAATPLQASPAATAPQEHLYMRPTDSAPRSSKKTWIFAMLLLLVSIVGGFLGFRFFAAKPPVPNMPFTPQVSSLGGGTLSSTMPNDIRRRIREIEQTLTTTPKNHALWTELGNLYFDVQEPQKAIRAYNESLKLRPDNPDVLTDLGIMYREVGQPEKAVTLFQRATRIDPRHQNAFFNEGVVLYFDLGKRKEGKAAWRRILNTNPRAIAPNGQSIREMLDGLED